MYGSLCSQFKGLPYGMQFTTRHNISLYFRYTSQIQINRAFQINNQSILLCANINSSGAWNIVLPGSSITLSTLSALFYLCIPV